MPQQDEDLQKELGEGVILATASRAVSWSNNKQEYLTEKPGVSRDPPGEHNHPTAKNNNLLLSTFQFKNSIQNGGKDWQPNPELPGSQQQQPGRCLSPSPGKALPATMDPLYISDDPG